MMFAPDSTNRMAPLSTWRRCIMKGSADGTATPRDVTGTATPRDVTGTATPRRCSDAARTLMQEAQQRVQRAVAVPEEQRVALAHEHDDAVLAAARNERGRTGERVVPTDMAQYTARGRESCTRPTERGAAARSDADGSEWQRRAGDATHAAEEEDRSAGSGAARRQHNERTI
jgi:ParB-like chromosome segregation protein Spo0J